jgi:hypothetical protein
MSILLFGAAGVVVAMVIGYLVNQLPPIKNRGPKVHWMIIIVLVFLGVSSGSLTYWQYTAQESADPMAVIQTPQGGEKIPRVVAVDIGVTRQPSGGHSLWLGYQNEAGGPLIVQTQDCVVFQKSADCGPLTIGHDERDPSSFKIFLFDADKRATGYLKSIGGKTPGGPGTNMQVPQWPDGTQIISMIRNITLRRQ